MRLPLWPVLAAMPFLLPGSADAQLAGVPVALEVRGAAAFAAGDFAASPPGLEAGAGGGFAAGARVGVMEFFSLYGLYRYGRFGCDGCESVGLESNATDAGFEAGLRGTLPFFSTSSLESWVSVGALVAHELRISGGGGALVSDPGIGIAAGAGIDVPIFGGAVSLAPGLHYRTYTASFDFADLALPNPFGGGASLSRDVDVSHVSLELGLSYAF